MKYLVLVAAVSMQMCLGATYSWSVYVQPLKNLTGLQQGPVQIPFTVFYFVFPVAMLIAGSMLARIGTRRSAMIGGLLFGGGWVVAGFGHISFLLTILGIGVLAGIGAGMAYIVPIAVCIQWFPQNKGLVTGVAVAGFGGGAALVSHAGGWCMDVLQMTPFATFLLLGMVFAVVVFSAGTTMRPPAGKTAGAVPQAVALRRFLAHPAFHLLYLAMFTGLAAGFSVNANLKEMYNGPGDIVRIGVMAVSLFAVANAAGRVLWGLVFDRLKSPTTIQLNLYFQALVLFAAPMLLDSETGFYLLASLTGFNYGGVLVIYVSSASRIWGSANVGQVYGWLFSSNIPASLAPLLAGLVYDHYGSFRLVYTVLALVLLCSGILVALTGKSVVSATTEPR